MNGYNESQISTLSNEKSVLIHVGNTLNVQDSEMFEAESVKYLSNIVVSQGGVTELSSETWSGV